MVSSLVTELFEQGGGLSDTLSHFELRDGQVKLVEAIDQAIDDKTHLIAEAGTGIGKTFSYLLPAVAKKKKVFVSTATKHLQDQVFFKDLPIIEKVVGRKVSACLLKGRSNYFCHYRFHEFFSSQFALDKSLVKKVNAIRDWSERTKSGDLSEVSEFAFTDIGLKKQMTSTTDNCLNGECPYIEDCFLQKVREKAKKSEVVIVNHALLMADIVLKSTGFAEILPEVDIVVIDEAHHLPKIATQAFAEQISASQMKELGRDALRIYHKDAGDVDEFVGCIEQWLSAIDDFSKALVAYASNGNIQLSELKKLNKPYEAFKNLMQAYKPLLELLSKLKGRSDDLGNIHERANVIARRIKTVFSTKSQTQSEIGESNKNDSQTKNKSEKLFIVDLQSAANKAAANHSVAILEWNEDFFNVSRLPINLGYRFTDVMQTYADSWIFVSATLSVNHSFDFFNISMGLPKNIETLVVDSPFDYKKQAVIHVATDLPAPNHESFVRSFVKMSLPVIKKMHGRTFMLFTSFRNLHAAADLIEDQGFNVFVQGDMPKPQLISAFIKTDNSVLMGTVSFWEGVDVPGDNLSCVIIDKIPFPSPGDPIIAEQARYLEQEGKNAFSCCYMPRAATLLKQGAGRLIRSTSDKGVLIFGDSRLTSKSYGKQLLAAMPPANMVDKTGLMNFIENEL